MSQNVMEQKERIEPTKPAAEREVTVAPRVDVIENDDELVVLADLPGVAPDGVDIRFEDGELTLFARRSAQRVVRPWMFEFEPANFHRVFRIAEHIAADRISAEMKDGVLTLRLPKVEAAKPRRIAVKPV